MAVGQSSRLRKQGLLQMVIRPGSCRRDARPVAWPACRPATSRPTVSGGTRASSSSPRRIAVALAATRSRPATAVHARAAVRPGSSAAGPNAQPGSRISRSRIVALPGNRPSTRPAPPAGADLRIAVARGEGDPQSRATGRNGRRTYGADQDAALAQQGRQPSARTLLPTSTGWIGVGWPSASGRSAPRRRESARPVGSAGLCASPSLRSSSRLFSVALRPTPAAGWWCRCRTGELDQRFDQLSLPATKAPAVPKALPRVPTNTGTSSIPRPKCSAMPPWRPAEAVGIVDHHPGAMSASPRRRAPAGRRGRRPC